MSRSLRAALSVVVLIAVALYTANPSGALPQDLRAAAAVPTVRFSEIHYDNAGVDTGEAIEISGPAGMDITGWQIVLYDGSDGSSYSTTTLAGLISTSCGDRGVIITTYPPNGIQNGSPDGMALVDAGGAVVEYLSYEGIFTAVGGPATDLSSADIGAFEDGTGPADQSLGRQANGTWNAAAANTFGACNDSNDPPTTDVVSVSVSPASATVNPGSSQVFVAAAFDTSGQPVLGTTFTWLSSDTTVATVNNFGTATAVASGDTTITATAPNGVSGNAALHVDTVNPPSTSSVRLTEIHYDNAGVDTGEAIEIEGPLGLDVSGWELVLYDATTATIYSTVALTGDLLTAPTCAADHGLLVVTFPSNGIQNGSPDAIALVDAAGAVRDFISYEGAYTATAGAAAGLTAPDIGEEPGTTPIGNSLQRNPSNATWSVRPANFGACNSGSGTQPPLASIDGPFSSIEGGAVVLSAAASIDPDGTIASVAWDFGDGATAIGETVTHVYIQDGAYTVRATISDNDGLTATASTVANVANVPPVVAAFAGGSLLPGEQFNVSGSFADAGADPWTATVDWGDGSSQPATLIGHTFAAGHVYTAIGTFTVTVTVTDDDTVGAKSQVVTVLTVDQALANAVALVDGLVSSGKLGPVVGSTLKLQLNVAAAALRHGYTRSALFVVEAVIVRIDGLVRQRRLSATDAAPLRALLARVATAFE